MTTISTSASALTSLAALYQNGNQSGTSANGGTSGSSLTSAQVDSMVGLVDNGASTASTTDGSGDFLSSGVDTSSLLDEIAARTEAATSGSTTSATTTTSTATTEQQKAAALMQSVYQTQQSNLFTLLA